MNDDYLWDKSGEPDPEVERLERVLGKYRYQPTPISPALKFQFSRRPSGWMRFAAIAAAILILLAGFWIFTLQNKSVGPVNQSLNNEQQLEKDQKQIEQKRPEEPKAITAPSPQRLERSVVALNKRPKVHNNSSVESIKEAMPEHQPAVVAERVPLMNPFVGAEVARHIERAQVLLRSFRNTHDDGKQIDPEILYERQNSRALLYKNILLRRNAEAKGNMPVEELLGGLEPFLLDIANLSDKPSNDDVRSIKQRMQKKEIISALQIYSAPILSQAF